MVYRFGAFELDDERYELRTAGRQVPIEPKAFEVLRYLLQHHDRVVTKQELLEHHWADTFVTESALTRCMAKIRRAVHMDDAPPIIRTVHGQGYHLVATVEREPSTAPSSSTTPPKRSKILIVDDEPFNLDILDQELEALGYDTVRATNVQEALEQVAAQTPDLILLDVMMPVMDGLTVCQTLKSQEATRLIPIVIMTALDAMEDRLKGINAGADDFLTKPVHEEELLARIQTSLALKHAMDRKIDELQHLKDQVAQFVRQVSPPDHLSQ